MKNKNANLFILICAILTFMFSSYADQDEEHLINKAREHIREHSVIDNTIIDEMTASIEYQFGYPHIVAFQYFSFSEPILSVSFNRNCDIVYCTCTELTTEEYQKDLDYVRNMKEAALATIEWENRYGPCELWEVDINAEFYERYHYHPKETQQFYEHSISNGCGFPPTDHISPDDALRIADQILTEHFHCDDVNIKSLRTGMSFYLETSQRPSVYYIGYYSGSDNNLEIEYLIALCSENGICYTAQNQKYQYDEGRDFSKGTPLEAMEGIWWSEYFDIIRLDDGSFLRVEKDK